MISPVVKRPFERLILSALDGLPVAAFYAKTRGWPFVIAWIHRLTAIFMVVYIWFHILTLSSLMTPPAYDAKMKYFGFVFSFLEWLLAVPVIFHALNGGRLILYEIFATRKDESMIRWVFGLAVTYFLLLGLLMIMGNQTVSPIFFWLTIMIFSISPGYLVASKIWNTASSLAWKLQRISGAFLLIMIPAHLLFMHLQPTIGHEANVVIARMQSKFIKLVDLTLVIAVLYHAGYGLMSISKDYLKTRLLQNSLTILIFLMMAAFGWIGIRLTLTL
jgi:succinate dehydrogenase hydrophobic membrane anchor protein